ncbi:TetR family transcriptional regulator [Nocardioides bizhenqiangii]|uniref:TetR family transcriptional regulator n=1 Tax=Nocardioides bizhenqiangii TaxID=3095076 RepID=A0ABZ0ZWX3_9ACTN|nr:TetR family transcriptional regulator [Nocardioides sp. HM61]WQQ28826.1 TetR family transcriptional regulator [Nocardioides sp. HM61]
MHAHDARERLLDATLRTVAEQGIARVSARTVAAEAGVNQALVFYHFGSVDDLLAAACQRGAEARVERYRAALEDVGSLSELVVLARRLHAQEREAGNVALLGQLLAGAQSHPALADPTAAGLALWVTEVERVLHRLLERTPLHGVVDVPGLARAVSASFVGLELYEAVDEEGANAAIASLEQLANLLSAFEELGPIADRAVRRRLRRTTSG